MYFAPSTTSIEFNIAGPPRPESELQSILDARLIAEPRIRDFRRSAREDSILASSDAPPSSIVRTVRLRGQSLTIVAVPDDSESLPGLRQRLRTHWKRRELLVISERWLRRRPHLDGAGMIAASAGYPISPLARILLADHLTDHGGSSCLGDCAACVPDAGDPVRAVLALAAAKTLAIDISHPIGPLSRVCLLQPG